MQVQRAVADGSDIQSRIQGKVDADIDQAKQEQQQQAGENGQGGEQAQAGQTGAAGGETAAAPPIDRAQVDAKKGELQGPAQPAIDPASQQGAVSSAADQAQASASQPAEPIAQAPQPPTPAAAGAAGAAGAGSGSDVASAAIDAASQAAAVAKQAFSQASSTALPDLPQAVVAPEAVIPLDAAGQQLPADTQADTFTASVATRVQALREQGHAVKTRAASTRANASRVQGNIQLAQGQVAQAQGGVQQSQAHTAARRDVVGQAQAALAVSQQKAATVAEQAPQVQSQADHGHARTGPIASESQELSSGAAANAPDDSEAASNAQQSGQQLNQASGDTQSVDSSIAQTQTRAGGLAQEAAQATATNTTTQSTIDTTQSTLDATDQHLSQLADHASQAQTQLASLAAAPAAIQAQADQQDAAGDELIQASFDLETQLNAIQQDYLAGMASVPQAPPDPVATTADAARRGPAVQRDAADYAYDSRGKVNLADLWSAPGDLTPQQRQQQQLQRQQQAQQQAQHRRDQLNEINALSGGHFDQLDATDKMGIAVQLTLGNLFSSVADINWPDLGANLIRGLVDPTVSLQGVLSGFNLVLSGGANLLSAEQWARDPLGNLLKSAADIVTGLTIVLGSIAGLCLALTVVCGALIIFSFGTLAPVLGPAIAFFTSVMATVGPWAIEFAEVALVLQGLVLIKNLIDAATAQTADQLYTASEKMTEDAKNAGQMALQVGMAEIMEGGGEAPEAPTLEPEAAAIPAEPPALEPLPEPEPVLEPGPEPALEPGAELAAAPGAEPAAEPLAPEAEPAAPEATQEPPAADNSEPQSGELDAAAEDQGIRAKETTPDGHEVKVTESGRLVECSVCTDALAKLEDNYSEILQADSEAGGDLHAQMDEVRRLAADPATADQALEKLAQLKEDLRTADARSTMLEETGEPLLGPGDTQAESNSPNARTSASNSPSEILGQALEDEGMPVPEGHEPHHIVAEGDPRAVEAQEILEEAGVNPNDPENGIPLRRGAEPETAGPHSTAPHESIHTDAYYEELTDRLRVAREHGNVADTLQEIRTEISEGRFPSRHSET